MISAAVVAAAVGLVPGVAQAAGPSADRTPGATATPDPAKAGAAKTATGKTGSGTGNTGAGTGKTGAEGSKAAVTKAELEKSTFFSPAERAVRTTPSGAPAPHEGPAPAQRAGGAEAASGDPYLGITMGADNTSARGIRLTAYVMSITDMRSVVDVTVDWGDGSTQNEYLLSDSDYPFLHLDHAYTGLGAHKVTVTATNRYFKLTTTNTVDVVVSGSEFTPHAPTRLLDTRNGTGAPSARAVAPYGTTRVKVAGAGGIPAGASAVALNLTATNTTAAGHVTAYAAGTEQPTTSNVNFAAGQSVPNMAIVPVSEDGYVELANRSAGATDLIADVTGYFTRSEANGYTSLAPTRLVDTREGLGTDRGKVAGQRTFDTQIAGRGGVPAGGVTAVALNVTVTNPEEAGHLTLFPSGQQTPTTSNLNFTAGQTVANSVIVPVGPDGRINVRNGSWNPADVIVDVVGYYSADGKAAYRPLTPKRLTDTREWNWPVDGQDYRKQEVSADKSAIEGAVLNVTVTNTQGSGHLTVAPDPNSWDQYTSGKAVRPTPPNSSHLNWTKGTTVSNLVQTSTGLNSLLDFWNRGWEPTDLVVDMFGVYDRR
ncbi:hypothetical protein ACFV7Q_32450 [Streptomyces sp. NPDC059851]|uniref:hypothetical protein n=1 Tax=Streptomyces sp. NPDC059851 TaxID=3346971 RepID=UPI00364A49B9